jgi:hypothetical protein
MFAEIERLSQELTAEQLANRVLLAVTERMNTAWQHDPPDPGDTKRVQLRVVEIDPVMACDFPGMDGIVVETVEPPRA